MESKQDKSKVKKSKNKRKLFLVIFSEIVILISLAVGYHLYVRYQQRDIMVDKKITDQNKDQQSSKDSDDKQTEKKKKKLTEAELKEKQEQERLQKEQLERDELIKQADHLVLGYYYEEAIDLIKSYQGSEGDYKVYPVLVSTIARYEAMIKDLVPFGGVYTSTSQINHIFFHSLIVDSAKAFDKDYDAVGYNMYMTTVLEFNNMMQKMYEDNYVLVSVYDITEEVTLEDGTKRYKEKEILLPKGKKPFVLSQDDVNYYEYMDRDGFASRIIVGEDGKPTCEMILEDGSVVTGDFDMVPIIDTFVEEHPDFSYRGAKGILAITGYEGTLGYRTNNPNSPTYEQDKETVKKVAEALRANGWEFASHSWGHKNMQTNSYQALKQDMNRWFDEVGSLIGPTELLIFPFGIDIETTMGPYKSDKYKYLSDKGFRYYMGVYKDPWMQINKDYVRMTRRPLDGQAMLQFPERLADLFNVDEIIDPARPERNW